MASFATAKKIFKDLVEYPLPKRAGTKDYVYHFVSADDGYGKGARQFFNRFYKNHRKKNVGSLQELIEHLDNEVRNRGITHIREVVIVSHGAAAGLICKVVKGGAATQRKQYKYLTAGSLAALQGDFNAGKFAAFNTKRKRVIGHLTNDSWVTIRACNFGQSRASMYALYSFFGGHANLYSPTVYQFFGSHPIMEDMRLDSMLEVHEHQVKQRFLPRDTHTPSRKNAVVRFLVDPGRFREPAEFLTANVETASPESQAYEQLIDRLNAKEVTGFLKARLAEHDITLTGKAEVSVIDKDTEWRIKDRLEHAGKKHPVVYELSERIELPNATLIAEGNLPAVRSNKKSIPLQLFFRESDNRTWRGEVFTLAGYVDTLGANPDDKTRFEQTLALLAAPPSVPSELAQLFEGKELGSNPILTLQSATGSPPSERKTWLLKGDKGFLIRLEHPASSDGKPAHTLTVYTHFKDKKARLDHEFELMADLGHDPDTPGTELMAYLDRHGIDDLAEFVDYLRDTPKIENVPYLHHAHQAIRRKQGFFKWEAEKLTTIAPGAAGGDPLAGIVAEYGELSRRELEDRRTVVYEFEPNSYWAEVKASNPPSQPFQTDLFSEQTLAVATSPAHLEPESPFGDLDELRAQETQGLEAFVAVEKFTFDPPEPTSLSCAQFANLLAQLKALEGKSTAEIDEGIRNLKLTGDISIWTFRVVPKPLKFAFNVLNVMNGSGGIPEIIVTRLIEHAPRLSLGTYRLTAISVHITRALPYLGIITLLGEMFLNHIIAHSNAAASWERAGKWAGIRQWVRELITLTHNQQDSFPSTVTIDLGTNAVQRYLDEVALNSSVKPLGIVGFPDRLKKGFRLGVALIEVEAAEILRRASAIMDDALRQGGLDNCMIQVLKDAGLVAPARTRALIMRQFGHTILRVTPERPGG